MIALLIKAGYAIFPHEFGVRFFTVILNTATIFLTRKLIPQKNDYLFYGIAFTMVAAQIGGIIAVPDAPLIFSVALFFWLYKRFSADASLKNALLLGFGMALMLYSKYHGVLIIFFTLLSDFSLFKKYQTWIAGLFTAVLFAPHLYWQYQHGFPSVQFHLFERSADVYKPSYTIEYLLGQIALTGPLMGWLLLWAAFQFKPKAPLERALKFSLIGIYAFFLLMTFKGRVEANWTLPAFIPLMILSYQVLINDAGRQQWLMKSVPITLVLVLLTRIYLSSFFPSTGLGIKSDEVHGNKTWVNAVHRHAAGLPVVFTDSYQRASKYWFYSGQPTMSLNSIYYRRNNYNFWPVEDSMIGKKVMVITKAHGGKNGLYSDALPQTDSLTTYTADRYYAFSKVMVKTNHSATINKGVFSADCNIVSPRNYLRFYQQPDLGDAFLAVSFYSSKQDAVHVPLHCTLKEIRDTSFNYQVKIPVSLPPGDYTAKFGISTCIPGFYTLNSTSFDIEVK
ncbi:hypothetical protein HHL16_03685 [Pseudoflavitalea sp. G-6-1-2]|uniref:ArnT family glycosyltransferase n=1 Tax=Pseudoflavitalea sp. G-6-1-2 TaxID=2728841 RepID=UPI00146B7DAF|nr:glycosyltransferase family 39 protein [Pseudoflavitalea sp. G-6-1-2]NML19958.1 hypothetical protein [Pseudoflavitalea sp. G-6-1-2]